MDVGRCLPEPHVLHAALNDDDDDDDDADADAADNANNDDDDGNSWLLQAW